METKKIRHVRKKKLAKVPRIPPPLDVTLHCIQTYRWKRTDSSSQTLSTFPPASTGGVTYLGQCFLSMVTTTTVSFCLVARFRIRRITLWTFPTSTGSTATIEASSTNSSASFADPNLKVTETSTSSDEGARVTMVPPRGSVLSMWQTVTFGSAAFQTISNPSSVLDVEVEQILFDGEGNQTGKSLTGATPGIVFQPILTDGSAVWTPASYNAL